MSESDSAFVETVTYLRQLFTLSVVLNRYASAFLFVSYSFVIMCERSSLTNEPCHAVADATMAGRAHCAISVFDILVASTVAVKSLGSARATRAGADYSATRISTIAQIISHA